MNKKILIAFGILDLIAFAYSYKLSEDLLNNIEHISVLAILEILLWISLLASGILAIIRKKTAFIIYYIQFPFKFLFIILTFSFLFYLFNFQYNSNEYRILLWSISLLEIIRLVISIRIHKKEFRNT